MADYTKNRLIDIIRKSAPLLYQDWIDGRGEIPVKFNSDMIIHSFKNFLCGLGYTYPIDDRDPVEDSCKRLEYWYKETHPREMS